MRTLAVIVMLLGCGDDDSGGGGTSWRDAAVDVPVRSCDPSAVCAEGPQCGTTCCTYGEHCENGSCMCGDQAGCLDGDYCISGGAVEPAAGCGLFCCGPVSGIGCPI